MPDQTGPNRAGWSASQGATGWPIVDEADGGNPDDVDAAAVAAYQASADSGTPLSERKLAAMFGKTSRRWARNRMAEARPAPETEVMHTAT